MFTWQQHPETRRHARRPRPPTRVEHQAWLAKKLADPDVVLQIISDGGAPAGALRLDPVVTGAYEVSILVDPARHGRGIGKAALALARDLRPAAELRAEVLPGNAGSHALFRNAGYRSVDDRNYRSRPARGRPVIALHPDEHGAGLGHAQRSAGLARALAAAGLAPLFLITPEGGIAGYLKAEGFDVFECAAGPADVIAAATGAKALVIDHYRIDMASLARAAKGRMPVIAFDDTGDHGLAADVLVNGSPAAETFGYGDRTKARLLLGPAYQIIRRDLKQRSRDRRAEPERLLVTIGGGDPLGITPALLDMLETKIAPAWPDLAIDYVTGPLAPPPASSGGRIRLHHAPADMAALISAADVAVSGGGQTLFELIYCGVPTVAICLADNQRPNLDALDAGGCISTAADASKDGWPMALETELLRLLEDGHARAAMASLETALIDGRGANRIAQAIGDLCGVDRAAAPAAARL